MKLQKASEVPVELHGLRQGCVVAWIGIVAILLVPMAAWGHKPSDSYLRLEAGSVGAQEPVGRVGSVGPEGSPTLRAQWDIALKDLEFLVGLDADLDSQITWGEVKAAREAIVAYALSRLDLQADGRPVTLTVTDLLIDRDSDGAYAVLVIDTDAPADVQTLSVRYSLLFDADPTHRGLVLYTRDRVTSTHILSPDSPTSCSCSRCCCPRCWCGGSGRGGRWRRSSPRA